MTQNPAEKLEEEATTELGDGDGGGDELEIELIDDDAPRPLCTWTRDVDEHRRAYVARLMADSQYEGTLLVRNMDLVYRWLRDGSLPKEIKQKKLASVTP